MSFGKRLKYVREKAGMSQSELASLMSVKSYTVISTWEADKNCVNTPKLEQLCRIFNKSADYFIFGSTSEIELSSNEYQLLTNFRNCDAIGKDVILSIAGSQKLRCEKDLTQKQDNNKQNEDCNVTEYVLSAQPINENIFLSKDDSDYTKMKALIPELRQKRKQSFAEDTLVVRLLHYSGYNTKIGLIDLEQLFLGAKVPSKKLYNDLLKIYKISREL